MVIRAIAILLASAAVATSAPGLAAAAAPTAPADNGKAAGAFISDLAQRAYGVLRDKSNDRNAVRSQFRALLKENFAITDIGNRLIRRHVRTISKQQYQAYQAAFPDYVVDTYTDNLFEFADSELRIVRTVPRGTRGTIDVYARVTRKNGAQPIDSIWTVKKTESGKYLVDNLTVAGVNLSLTQEADFTAYIQKNGFDALLQFMKDRKSA
ncbi:MlaC/ttg2D family ABC transporter substrate-binding protein [Sphingosinicella microcystinivorans]|uniref:MlaC/ttg2D family ABC transporter substrate-binding protein n=1 Tax=Sphingosinicella microcystinivorans TaxID=335406 RepID=UPI0022F389FE|nr:ABC transporter substrate-binding protein [Sphingosinicella microcystinivorans]WBX83334.1 ABC transporter substrate-binding protein [Sphingosinicella microcystinivorans]